MTETETVRSLRLMFGELPRRAGDLDAIQLRVLAESVNVLYDHATRQLDVNPAYFGGAPDSVDTNIYPNWANLPERARYQIAQLTGLFNNPERYVRVDAATAEKAFETILEDTKALFDRLVILLSGNARDLCFLMDQLPGIVVHTGGFTAQQLEEGVSDLLVGLIDDLRINPTRLVEVTDESGRHTPWAYSFSEDARNQVARVKAICMDPVRFVPPGRRIEFEKAFGAACGRWRLLLAELALDASL